MIPLSKSKPAIDTKLARGEVAPASTPEPAASMGNVHSES